MTIRGSVDGLSSSGAFGWAYSGVPGSTLTVQGLLAGRIVGEAVADQHRPDLAAAGFGDGRCGFTMNFYDALDPALLPFVSIKPEGGDVELPRTNLTGFSDFFRTLHARHPGAGRHRSVFGGLWTDRTDAARVLAGRVAAGATPTDLQGTLRAFINEGFTVLRGALGNQAVAPATGALAAEIQADQALDPHGEERTRGLLADLPGVLFRETPLRVLRAILDDNPICYRGALSRGAEGGFGQASTAEALPSPAECVLLVVALAGESVALDIVRGSHELPEFTADGRSRWLVAGAAAALDLALAHGASVDSVELGPSDLAVVGPGTLHRLRTAEGATALRAWCAPQRVTPLRFIANQGGTFALRHPSGATLAI